MPNNGAAVALPFALTPPSASVPATGKPAAAPAGAPITLGEEVSAAVASAVTGLCFALNEYQNGGLRPETRRAIGERTARVAMMQLELGDQVFAVHARGARHVLRRSLDADYFRRYSLEQADEAIDMFVGELLAVVGRVVEDERAFVRAMAN